MPNTPAIPKKWQRELQRRDEEIESLRAQLEEAKETLAAIQSGAVDALVIDTPRGQRIFTLEGAEHSYRALVEQMGEGAVALKADGTIHYCNRGFADLLRLPLSQIVGTLAQGYVVQAHQPTFADLLRRGFAGNARGEIAFQAADGSAVPAQVGISLLADGGPAVAAAMIVTNLTEKRRAEHVLASEQFVHRLIDNAPIGVAVVGRDLRYLLTNPAYQAIAGSDAASLAGRGIAEVFPLAVVSIVEPAVQQVLHSGQPVEFHEYETPIRGRSWWDVSAIPLHDAAGNAEAVLLLTQEVTERKLAEEGLRDSEQRFRIMADGLPQMIWVHDAQGQLQFVNQPYCEFFGVTPQQVAGPNWQPLMHCDDAAAYAGEFFACMRDRRRFHAEVRVRRFDGEWRWIESHAQPRFSVSGEFLGMVGSSPDITERKQAEAELAAAKLGAERAKEAAEAASNAKDHFLAVLSHEMRTPLAPVVATVVMLQADPRFDADTRDSLAMIRRNVEMEARLIDDLLDVTRIEKGKIELDRQPVDLGTIIHHAAEVCMPDIQARNVEFGIDAADGPYWVDADAARLQQVLWNLLKNAIKFTPASGCVGIRCWRDVDGYVIAEVNDSGEGIDPEVLPRLFNAFEQESRQTTRQFGGLGLGLAISKALTEMHGGTLVVRSEGKGKGATFALRLPLLTAEAAVLSPTPISQAPAPAAPTRSVRILLVEDHGDTARIMRRLLSAKGHKVQMAADITTALKLALAQPFDLMLSDLGLPDGSGLDLMRAIRAKGLKLPGIALSGYGQEKDMRQSREAGFVAHLIKPVSLPKLEEAIARIVGQGIPLAAGDQEESG